MWDSSKPDSTKYITLVSYRCSNLAPSTSFFIES